MQVKVVLFDAAGVLFPANKVVGDALSKRFKLTESQLNTMWEGFYQDYTVGKLSTEQFLGIFAENYKLPRSEVTEASFTKSFRDALVPTPGIEDILFQLKRTGVTIAMLSDTTEMFASARHTWKLSKYFDRIFLSFEIGYKKPDPHAYQAVIQYYSIKPEEIFFTDDNQTNVDAAVTLGLQAALFTDPQSLALNLKSAGILL